MRIPSNLLKLNRSRKDCSKIMALILAVTFLMSFAVPISALAVADINLTISKVQAQVNEIVKLTLTDDGVADGEIIDIYISNSVTDKKQIPNVAGIMELDYTIPATLKLGDKIDFKYTDKATLEHTASITIIGSAPTVMDIKAVNSANKVGKNEGDSIDIYFSEDTNKPNINVNTDVTIVGGTFGIVTGDAFKWIDAKTLRVYFGSGFLIDYDSDIDIKEASNIKIASGYSLPVSTSYTNKISGTFGQGIKPTNIMALAINTNGLSGAQEGDKISLVFDSPTNGSDIKSYFDGFNFGTNPSYEWDSTKSIYTITLGEDSVVTDNVKIILKANSGLTDASKEIPAFTSDTEITLSGSYNNVSIPTKMNAFAINSNGTYEKIGDKVALIFDTKTNGADIISSLNDTFGLGVSGVWSNDNTVYTIELKTGATISVGNTITLASGSGLKDQNGNLPVGTLSATLQGSFGVAFAPKVARAYAIDMDGTAKVAGDKINIIFDLPVKNKTLTPSDLKLVNSVFGDNSTAQFLDAQTLEITIGTSATIQNNATIDISSLGLTDVSGTATVQNTSFLIGGSLGSTVIPSVVRAVAVDVDGTAKTTGDKIIVYFYTNTNKPTTGTLGGKLAGATYQWANAQTLEVTLGSTAITVSDTINLDTLNIKDEFGLVSANGLVGIALQGGFGKAIKPAITNVVAVSTTGNPLATKNDQIKIMFNTIVDHSNVTNISVLNGNLGSDFNYSDTSFVKWNDDASSGITVLTLVLGSNPTINVGTTSLRFVGKVTDVSGKEELNSADYYVSSGSFGYVITPELLNATIVKVSTTPLAQVGDKIALMFSAPTNGEDIRNILGVNFGTSSSYIWSNNNTLCTIIIGTGNNLIDGMTLALPANSILKDQYNLKSVFTKSISLIGSFGTEITQTILVPTTITASIVKNATNKPLAQAGDKIILTFNAVTNGKDNTPNLIPNLNSSLGTDAKGVWTNANTYEITLGTSPSVKDTDTLNLSAGNGIKDVNSKQIAFTSDKSITLMGSFGVPVQPKLLNAMIVKKISLPYSQIGDEIMLMFSAPTNKADIRSVLSVNFGSTSSINWTNNDTVCTITLGTDNNLTDSSKLTINTGSILKDKYDLVSAEAISNVALSGSFGTEITQIILVPTTITASIVKNATNKPLAQAGDKIILTFNAVTNGKDNTPNLIPYLNSSLGTDAKGVWTNANTYEITLGTNPSVKDTDTLNLSAGNGIKDVNSKQIAFTSDKSITLMGSFGVPVQPKLLNAMIVKKVSLPYAQIGDEIMLMFSAPTNKADIKSILSVNFGSTSSVNWTNNDTVCTITLGTNNNLTDSSKLTLNTGSILKDKYDLVSAEAISNIVLSGSFGTAANPVGISPKSATATIVKTSTNPIPKAQSGDKIYIAFNVATNGNKSNIMTWFNTNQPTTFGVNATGVWNSDNTVFTIILGDNPTIEAGATIRIPSDAGLKDKDEISNAVAITTDSLTGSFGTPYAPNLLSAVAYSQGNTNYIKFDFDVATNRPANIISAITVNTQFNQFGTGATGEWNSLGNIYTLTLGSNYSVKKNDDIIFTVSTGIKDKDGTIALANSSVKLQGELAKPVVLKVEANKDNKTISITFSSKTNGNAVDLSSQSSLLGTGASSVWSENNTVLTITLGTNYTISAESGYIVLNGLGIKDGFSETYDEVGQFAITSGDLPITTLCVKRVVAYCDKDFTTNTVNSNKITILFNSPTNMNGQKINDVTNDVSGILTVENGNLGTGYTAKWISADRLEITLGSVFELTPKTTTFTFKNLKFASGLSSISTEAVTLSGSFSGRQFDIVSTSQTSSNGFITFNATVSKNNFEYVKDVVITFVMLDNNKVVSINAVKISSKNLEEISSETRFTSTSTTATGTVYITDGYIDDVATFQPILAEPKATK